ncbi:MAG: hypothetical protein AAFP17_08635 [Pseudomonadota bacterium]
MKYCFIGLNKLLNECGISKLVIAREAGLSPQTVARAEFGAPQRYETLSRIFYAVNQHYDDRLNISDYIKEYDPDRSVSSPKSKYSDQMKTVATASAVGAGVAGIAGELGSLFGLFKKELRSIQRSLDDVVSEHRMLFDLKNTLRSITASAAGIYGTVYYLKIKQEHVYNTPLSWTSMLSSSHFSHVRDTVLKDISSFPPEDRLTLENEAKEMIWRAISQYEDVPMDRENADELHRKINQFYGDESSISFSNAFEESYIPEPRT